MGVLRRGVCLSNWSRGQIRVNMKHARRIFQIHSAVRHDDDVSMTFGYLTVKEAKRAMIDVLYSLDNSNTTVDHHDS